MRNSPKHYVTAYWNFASRHQGAARREYFIFYDKGFVIVCAVGLCKKTNKTPDSLIDQAIAIRQRYRAALRAGELTVDDDLGGDEE
jgi:phage-related protein